jgi:hypothetical protein
VHDVHGDDEAGVEQRGAGLPREADGDLVGVGAPLDVVPGAELLQRVDENKEDADGD